MKLLFRTDGNRQIGAGHIMRCLSIAQQARKQGVDCVFLTSDNSYCSKIEDEGIRCIVLDTDYRKLEDELPQLLEQLTWEKPDKIIIDSYYATETYFNRLKKVVYTIYIDDLALFAYPVDALINYNSYAHTINYQSLYQQANIPLPQLFLGPQFAPLRKEFQDIPAKEVSDLVKDIFVSVGGSDPGHILMKILKYLIEHQELTENKQYHLVVSDFEPDREAILSMAATCPWMIPHQKVKEMAKLMLSCDIAVSAAGSTLYELCACGIPTVTYVLEDNQIPGAQFFSTHKIMKSAGDLRYDAQWLQKVFDAVNELCQDKNLRKWMGKKAKSFVHGDGAGEIIKGLCFLTH